MAAGARQHDVRQYAGFDATMAENDGGPVNAAEIGDKILEAHPYMFRNNRGAAKTEHGYITFGIPAPPKGRRERDDDLKGSDYVGFIVVKGVPIFAAIEVKTKKDRLKTGQVRWLKFVDAQGGIAQLWQEVSDDTILITSASEL